MNKRLAELPIGSKHPPGPPMTLGNKRAPWASMSRALTENTVEFTQADAT